MNKKFAIWSFINLILIIGACALLRMIFTSGEIIYIIFGTLAILITCGISIRNARSYAKSELDTFVSTLIANAMIVLFALGFIAMIFLSISLAW